MTRAEAITAVEDGLGGRENLTTTIVRHLKRQQALLEAGPFLPWFLLKRSSGYSITGGNQTLAVPTDFIREAEEDAGSLGSMYYTDSDGKLVGLEKSDVVRMLEVQYSAEENTPLKYGLLNRTFYFFPTPASTLNLSLFYYGYDAVLGETDNATNLWLTHAPEVIVAATGRRVARAIRDPEAQAMFTEDFQLAFNAMVGADTANKEASRNRLFGEEN